MEPKNLNNPLKKSGPLACGSCIFLEEPLSKWGEIKPCKQRRVTVKKGFQKEDSPICEHFTSTDINYESSKATRLTSFFSHIIENDFQTGKDAFTTSRGYESFLQREGIKIPFNSQDFVALVGRLSHLRTLDLLCNAMGLMQYAPHLILAEIAKQYKIPITQFPKVELMQNLTIPVKKKKKLKNKDKLKTSLKKTKSILSKKGRK